jgi:hypothetical protein
MQPTQSKSPCGSIQNSQTSGEQSTFQLNENCKAAGTNKVNYSNRETYVVTGKKQVQSMVMDTMPSSGQLSVPVTPAPTTQALNGSSSGAGSGFSTGTPQAPTAAQTRAFVFSRHVSMNVIGSSGGSPVYLVNSTGTVSTAPGAHAAPFTMSWDLQSNVSTGNHSSGLNYNQLTVQTQITKGYNQTALRFTANNLTSKGNCHRFTGSGHISQSGAFNQQSVESDVLLGSGISLKGMNQTAPWDSCDPTEMPWQQNFLRAATALLNTH